MPQLQLRLTRAMGRTAKQQTWAAELTTGEHLNVLAELLPTALISRRDRIKQHHPIQTGQTEGLLQTPGLMATAGACITAHQSAAAAMAHQHQAFPGYWVAQSPHRPANAGLGPGN